MKQQTLQDRKARRREVMRLTHKGWTQEEIASHFKIRQSTVSRDLAAMRRFWREFAVYDFENVRFEQLQKIDMVEAEAWSAWERSQQKKQAAVLTRGKTGEQTRTSLHDQYGDPRYLREIARCVAQRNAMIGVEPPTAPPERAKPEVPECSLTDSFRTYLRLHGMFGDPPYQPLGGLKAEHYAALVAEHERDPYGYARYFQTADQENSAGCDAAAGPSAGDGDQPVSPENAEYPAEDRSWDGWSPQ